MIPFPTAKRPLTTGGRLGAYEITGANERRSSSVTGYWRTAQAESLIRDR